MDPIQGATQIDSIHFLNNAQLMKSSKNIYIIT